MHLIINFEKSFTTWRLFLEFIVNRYVSYSFWLRIPQILLLRVLKEGHRGILSNKRKGVVLLSVSSKRECGENLKQVKFTLLWCDNGQPRHKKTQQSTMCKTVSGKGECGARPIYTLLWSDTRGCPTIIWTGQKSHY